VRGRYPFVVLAVLIALATAANILFTVSVEHKFCQVASAASATPVQRPASAKASPVRETQWEWYMRFRSLKSSLGC